MQAFMTAAQVRAQNAKWGVQAKYLKGWETRGRPISASRPHKDARGITIHHTGSRSQTDDYNDFLFNRGRPEEGIPGPLANVSPDSDGDVIVGATGRANHAGEGAQNTLTLVSTGKMPFDGEVKPGPDSIDGNAFYYGAEVKYDGSTPMPTLARKSTLLWAASVCDFHEWNAGHVCGHKEHTRRKGDPGHENMGVFRTDLDKILDTGPGTHEPAKDTTITRFCVNRVVKEALGVSDDCLGDNYQVMNIAVFLDPALVATRKAMWAAVNKGDWKSVQELQVYALKIIQSRAGIKQTGAFDDLTAKFLKSRGYTVL